MSVRNNVAGNVLHNVHQTIRAVASPLTTAVTFQAGTH